MARALELARRGRYSTQPNPCVGSVIVSAGEIVGEGYHQKTGEPHAEVIALRQAAERAKGATAYVTLEPCCHTGRTPPCAEKLVAAEVARVVYATEDPNPRVAGGGAARLRAAGIAVEGAVLAEEAQLLNRGFFHRMKHRRPFVTLKIAMSLDGKIGLKSGESKWITGPDARANVQQLRARSCAVLTGSGTVREDNPRLTVRDSSLTMGGRHPRVIVLDSRLSLQTHYDIFSTEAECIVVTSETDAKKLARFARVPVTVHQLGRAAAGVDLAETLDLLNDLECNEVLVEAGPRLLNSFIEQDMFNELIVYVAPKLIGREGQEGFALGSITSLTDARKLHLVETMQIGSDVRLTYQPY